MKAIKVQLKAKIQDDLYGHSGAKFAFCTKPDKNRKVAQIASLLGCREDLVDILRKRNNGKGYKDLDLRRTRLLIILRVPFNTSASKLGQRRSVANTQMQASLKLVNHYERKYGWALTRLYHADMGTLEPNAKTTTPRDVSPYIFGYVVVGSNKWMKSPHYMSLYALLLRLGRGGFAAKFRSQKSLDVELGNYANRQIGDGGHLRSVYKYIDIVMANQEELLEGRKDLYKKSALSNADNGYHEGIRRLCRNETKDRRLGYKFMETCKRYEI